MSNQIIHGLVRRNEKPTRIPGERARSVPHRWSYISTVGVSVVHYLSIVGAVTTLILFFIQPSGLATKLFVLFLFSASITWFLAFLKRRNTYCPLCKGTPLINSGALAHQKATKIFPLNHGISATLCIIATQTFRCMYCGTLFDLLKTPSHKLNNDYYNTYSSEENN